MRYFQDVIESGGRGSINLGAQLSSRLCLASIPSSGTSNGVLFFLKFFDARHRFRSVFCLLYLFVG